MQLHCRIDGGSQKRAIVVSGAYPLRAVGFTMAEAFGKAVCDFDPHPNKGKPPPGLAFSILRDGKWQILKATLKIVQAVQEPGDAIRVEMEGLRLAVTLDAVKLKTDPGFELIRNRAMPRCVGGDKGLTPSLLKRLNRTFFHDRKPDDFIGCSKKEKIDATIEQMARPIALRQGRPVIEGLVFGLCDQAGSIPGHELQPLVL